MKVVPTLRTAEKPSIVSSFVLISISTASVKCKSVCVCVWLPQPLSLSLSLLIQQVTHSRCGLIPLCQFAYTYRDPNGSFPFIYFASWPLSLSLLSLLLNLTLTNLVVWSYIFRWHQRRERHLPHLPMSDMTDRGSLLLRPGKGIMTLLFLGSCCQREMW